MIIRSTYLEGTVASAEREAFDAHMSGPVLAAIATYPGLRQVRLRKLALADAGARRSTWCSTFTSTAYRPWTRPWPAPLGRRCVISLPGA